MNTLTHEQIESLSPESLANYLEASGWQKQKEEEGFGSLWSYLTDSDEEVLLFLPLNRNYMDYTLEISDVFATLEYVENVPCEQILALIKRIYQEEEGYQERLSLQFKNIYEDKNQVPARKLGEFFRALQSLCDSIGKSNSLGDFEHKNVELSLVDTFHGSFGVQLVSPYIAQLEIDGETVPQKVFAGFFNLLKASSTENPRILQETVSNFDKKEITKKLKNFLSRLVGLDSNLFANWTCANSESDESISVKLSYANATWALTVIAKLEENSPTMLAVIGELILLGKSEKEKYRKFLIEESETGKNYLGSVSGEFIERIEQDDRNKPSIGGIYRAIIKEKVSYREIAEEEVRKYELIDLEPI